MSRKLLVFTILFLMISSTTLLHTAAAEDSDGDGVDDSVDDCPFAFGNSTIDRTGCPDADGDGRSDLNDAWTSQYPSFSLDATVAATTNIFDAAYSPTGEFVAIRENQHIKIYNTSTQTVLQTSAQISSSWWGNRLSWSPDGTMLAASISSGVNVYWPSNRTEIQTGVAPTDPGSVRDVAFFPNGTGFIAVGEGWGSNSGKVYAASAVNGTIWHSFQPNSDSSFSSVALSPDGSRAAVGGDGVVYVINTSSWQGGRTINHGSENVRGVDISPDGNWISACDDTGLAYQSTVLRVWDLDNGTQVMAKTGTSRCSETRFSPDGSQVGYSFHFYTDDAASVTIYHINSNALVTRLSARPTGDPCTDTTAPPNVCGRMYGFDWHPNGLDIISVMGQDNEGVYFWSSNLDPDNDGWNSTDQGDGKVDAFPDEPTQWADSDGDGYGDNALPAHQGDQCVNTFGKSKEDRFGCPDSDNDGWSDPEMGWPAHPDGTADRFPNDPKQWADTDLDGYGDNYYYDVQQFTELHINQSGDAFPGNPTQWNDSDGDGWGDNYHDSSWDEFRPLDWPGAYNPAATQVDKFPLFRYQWNDTDNDWIGDEPNTPVSDACPNLYGNSTQDRLGCLDSDGDGWSNPSSGAPAHPEGDADAFPDDATQWRDTDGDGFGDNTTGNNADDCPGEYGTSSVDRVGCPDVDGDGYSNAGDPFPQDGTQWSDQDGDNYGDNPDGNDPDAFPYDSSQWKDSDGDGYGDRPIPPNGDMFPNDPTQWSDMDNDGFGDNLNGNKGDVCPETYGKSELPGARGCPDSDNDGVVDPYDAFPDDFYQQTDNDGDGWGDNQDVPNGDECPEEYGTSVNLSIHGGPDSDGDSWADALEKFPEDAKQWEDTDGDGWGDNYGWVNKTIADEVNEGLFIVIRDQWGDAFPTDASQWSDTDGDGFGDNQTGSLPDAFPVRATQWADSDGDGYGDNHVLGSFQPDECELKYGESFTDYFGCPDSDKDGVSDQTDPCPYDSTISMGIKGQVACASFDDDDGDGIPNEFDIDYVGSSDDGGWDIDSELFILGGLIVFLLAIIIVAMVAKQAGKRKAAYSRAEEMKANAMMDEENERRQEWIDYYVAQGDTAKAMELGWTPPQEKPQWQQYQMEQEQAQQEAIPDMFSLDDL